MRTLGLIHRVETNGAITSISVEADSAQPAVDVFRSAFGPELTHRDLIVGNRIENRRLESISWGHWQRLNPITVVGAHSLRTTDACADSAQTTVSVVAGPDSGFTLTLDPRRVCLSRLTHADCLTLVDPCISRTPQPLRLDATGAQPAVHVGASVLAPTTAEGSAAGASSSTGRSAPLIRSPPLQRSDDIHIAPKTIDDPRPARPHSGGRSSSPSASAWCWLWSPECGGFCSSASPPLSRDGSPTWWRRSASPATVHNAGSTVTTPWLRRAPD